MVSGIFVHLDLTILQTMQIEWLACLSSIATGQQSYSIAGRTFTRANLKEVSETVSEIAYAIKLNSGGIARTVYSDMSN